MSALRRSCAMAACMLVAAGCSGESTNDRAGGDAVAHPETALPDAAAGVLHFDATGWTTFTMDDGLLSNDAVVTVGADNTVWALHYEIPPYGYSSYEDGNWTLGHTGQETATQQRSASPTGQCRTAGRGVSGMSKGRLVP